MISVVSDISDAKKALEGTQRSVKTVQRKALRIIGKGVVKAIKLAIGATTTKRTGELLKCYSVKIWKDLNGATITPLTSKQYKADKSRAKIFPKTYTLNYGLEGTKRKPRSFIQVGELYAESKKYSSEIETMVNKELSKYWS